MAVRFHLASPLAPFAARASDVEIPGPAATVGDALERLGRIHPGVRDRVLTEQGELRPHVNVFVGEESIRFLEGLATTLPEECEISILPAVSGG